MKQVIKAIAAMRSLLKVLGSVCLIVMTGLTCVDVVGRYLGHPVFGSVEIVGFMATLAAAMALPYTHQMKGHIGVEILVRLFSEKTQTAIELCTNAVALLLFLVVTWRMIVYAGTMRRSGEVSMNLEFPEHYIIYITAFCFMMFSLTIIEDLINNIRQLMGKE